MILELFDAFLNFFATVNYWGVFFLMVIESSFIPFPSEIVVPPAAYLAAQGKLNIWLIILASSLGSLVGALINYFLVRYLGRPIVYRLVRTKVAKFLLITEEKIQRAESFFVKYEAASTFFGRLVPIVRQLISLPAGFAKMKILPFVGYTFLGAFIWSSVLAALGYFFGAHDEQLRRYYQEIFWLLIFTFFFVLSFTILKHRRKKSKNIK